MDDKIRELNTVKERLNLANQNNFANEQEKKQLIARIDQLIKNIKGQENILSSQQQEIVSLQEEKTGIEQRLTEEIRTIQSQQKLQNEEKQSLVAFIETQQNLLKDKQKKLDETQEQLSSTKKTVERLNLLMQEQQNKLDKNQEDILSLRKQIFDQKNDITAKDELIQQKIHELDAKKKELNQREKANNLLEEDKNRLNNEIKELNRNIDTQREELSQQALSVQQLQKDKTALENQLLAKKKEIETHQTLSQYEKQALIGTIDYQKSILADNQRQLDETQEELSSAQEKIEKLNAVIKEYQEHIAQKEEAIFGLKKLIQAKSEEINHNNEMIKQKVQALEEKQAELTQKEQQNTLLEEEKNHLTNEINALIRDINYQKETLSQQKISIQELQTDKTTLERQLLSKEEEIKHHQKLSQNEKQSLLGTIDEQKNLLTEHKNQLNDVQEQLEASQKEIDKLKKTIQEYQQQLDLQKEDIITLQSTIKAKSEEINSNNEIIKQKVQALEDKQAELTQKEQQNTLLEGEKNRLNNEINALMSDINAFKNKLSQQETSIKELQSEKTTLENLLSSKEQEIKTLQILSQQEKQSLQESINQQKNLLEENQNQLNQTKDKLESSQKEIEKLKKNIQDYQKQLEQRQTYIDELKKQITEQMAKIDKKSEEIKNKNIELEQKQTQLRDGEKQNNLLEKDKNKLTAEIQTLMSDIAAQKQELTQQEQSIQKLQMDKNNLEKELLLKETEIKTLQTLSQKEKNSLQSTINQQKNILKENQTQLDKTKEQLRTAHFNIQEQEKTLKKNDQEFKYLKDFYDNTIDKLETIIEKTQKQKEQSDQLSVAKYQEIFELMKKELKDEAKERIKLTQTEIGTSRFLKDTTRLHSFKDVIGMEREKEQLLESLSYLKNPEEYKKMGVKNPPKGVLLYGPPGTGKTYLAEAFAKESGLPFYAVTSADFSRSYVGEGPRIIENLFEEARKHSPCIIFIDECESIFRKRNTDGLTSDHGNMISSFLSQIEGIYTDPDKPVFIIAATNFKDEIDIAILSRFNKLIELDYWKEEELKTFAKIMAKKYKLDVRAYKYLEKIMEQICKFGKNFLKTPRKIKEILIQAAGIAIQTHHHLNILPIDLQLAFDRISQSETLVDWGKHTHDKPDVTFLATMKEYKNIPLKHLFKDSSFSFSEKKYFDLINNHYQKDKKTGYNKYLNYEIESISFSDDKEKIKKTYNDENPLPDGLLGVYFEDKENTDPTKRRLEMQKIDSLEEILNTGMGKVSQIYLVWDYEKLKINQKKAQMLIDKFYYNYPFLRNNAFFKTQVLQKASEINNNEEEIEQFILTFLEEKIKQPLINNVFSQIVAQNLLIEENDKLEIKKIIAGKLAVLMGAPHILNLEEMQFALLSEIKTYLEVNKQKILEQQIDRIIEELKLNNMLFTSQQIKQFQTDLKKEAYNELVNLMKRKNHISLDEVKANIKDNSALLIDRLFYQTWQTIYPKLHIEIVDYEKNSLITLLQNKVKKHLFFTNFSLEEIVDLLQQEIKKYENNFEERLKEKVSATVHQYILIDRILEEQPNTETIELISKGAFLVAQKESQQPDVTEKKIQQEIYDFIKNYRLKNTHSSELYTWIKQNFYIILLTLIVLYIFLKSANKNQKRRY